MFDLHGVAFRGSVDVAEFEYSETGIDRAIYRSVKRVFDIVGALVLLPLTLAVAALLIAANPIFNAGPLFFIQARMGRHCRAFPAIKFRTMRPVERIARGADDPLELDRITRLGRFLRKSRLDELPQIFNVLRGDMSLIGPRPDYFNHARRFVRHVPGYRERHAVRPGISGLAQVRLGYANGLEATAAKVRDDLAYIRNAGFWLDTLIFCRTVMTILRGHGT
ncbi:UDP-N-acetylgalactosamine-undecaprenyl-phosphate N-acetylgalactosaminephosphotransferase [Roseivivax jejudonensis]|uniref:UDP-N-acetylgalactosamine-undecaprenyl-phosphate N-acetylgalactosaminephosphotransferase n=1 Tax=Roseivivax jejudonensis TaxID=1529041 RepID=A0A1X7ACJ2_9RHOB|nr:sugar transferase [Roseivivax jejudonensis]SLN74197.1 UDP-N-acetylgalactosamine-undecaprenyl-phosphate N-acetylgalactosaminephosphotransferase [Roseivivax jejudonensis]